jgi:hypothetical protein
MMNGHSENSLCALCTVQIESPKSGENLRDLFPDQSPRPSPGPLFQLPIPSPFVRVAFLQISENCMVNKSYYPPQTVFSARTNATRLLTFGNDLSASNLGIVDRTFITMYNFNSATLFPIKRLTTSHTRSYLRLSTCAVTFPPTKDAVASISISRLLTNRFSSHNTFQLRAVHAQWSTGHHVVHLCDFSSYQLHNCMEKTFFGVSLDSWGTACHATVLASVRMA